MKVKISKILVLATILIASAQTQARACGADKDHAAATPKAEDATLTVIDQGSETQIVQASPKISAGISLGNPEQESAPFVY